MFVQRVALQAQNDTRRVESSAEPCAKDMTQGGSDASEPCEEVWASRDDWLNSLRKQPSSADVGGVPALMGLVQEEASEV